MQIIFLEPQFSREEFQDSIHISKMQMKYLFIMHGLKDATSVIHLNYQKSIIIATYMLCGFANFASIGIQIGGIGALEPKQRKNLSKFGFKALIGGTLASLLSATIAGMIIG